MEMLSSYFKVRPIVEEDLIQVLELYQGNLFFFRHCPPEPSLASIQEDIRRLPDGKSQSDKYYLGFWEKEKLVAVMDFVYDYPNEETVFIGFFMVNSSCQGMGIGSRIIQETFVYFSRSFRKVRLAYVKTNPQAKHFWEKQGFLPTGIEVDEDPYTVVIMEKELCGQ